MERKVKPTRVRQGRVALTSTHEHGHSIQTNDMMQAKKRALIVYFLSSSHHPFPVRKGRCLWTGSKSEGSLYHITPLSPIKHTFFVNNKHDGQEDRGQRTEDGRHPGQAMDIPHRSIVCSIPPSTDTLQASFSHKQLPHPLTFLINTHLFHPISSFFQPPTSSPLLQPPHRPHPSRLHQTSTRIMSSVSMHTTAAPSHSHTLAPGPVITSGIISPLPSPIVSGTNIPPVVSGTSGLPSGGSGSPAAATPTAAPSTPSSASSTYTQKKVSLALALMVFLPAVINTLDTQDFQVFEDNDEMWNTK